MEHRVWFFAKFSIRRRAFRRLPAPVFVDQTRLALAGTLKALVE